MYLVLVYVCDVSDIFFIFVILQYSVFMTVFKSLFCKKEKSTRCKSKDAINGVPNIRK